MQQVEEGEMKKCEEEVEGKKTKRIKRNLSSQERKSPTPPPTQPDKSSVCCDSDRVK